VPLGVDTLLAARMKMGFIVAQNNAKMKEGS
jgi:hypothetical protein